MAYGTDRPQWGAAIAQAFQQGTSAVSESLRADFEERKRKEAERRQNMLLMLQTPGATLDPTREEVKAPTAQRPTQKPPQQINPAGEGQPMAPHVVGGPGASREVRGVSSVAGHDPVQGALAPDVRDLGEGFAEEFGFRYIDPTQTPEYRREMQEHRARAMAMKPYLQNQDVDSMGRDELIAAALSGEMNREQLQRLEEQAIDAARMGFDFNLKGAEFGIDPQEFELDSRLPDSYEDFFSGTLPGVEGIAGESRRRTSFGEDMQLDQSALGWYNAETSRRNADAAAENARKASERAGKPDETLALTLQNAREANEVLDGASPPGFLSLLGETAGGIVGVGPFDPALRNSWRGQNARDLEQNSKVFTEGVLRKMTGAAVTDVEFQNYATMFVPVAGDSDRDVQAKMQRRLNLIRTMEIMAESGYTMRDIEAAMIQDAKQSVRSGITTMGASGDSTETYQPVYEDNEWVGR